MKRQFVAALMVVAMAGFCGCGEEDDTSPNGSRSAAGTWNGTMQATSIMGQPVAESDVVPFTMNISQNGESITVVFQANGYPGVFSGWFFGNGEILFSATADYTYSFQGVVANGERSMSGRWTVDIPGGMSGSWQASR